MKLSYVMKINHSAKYCGKMKQMAYDSKDYGTTHFYKNEQRKLYLLKALCILHLTETGSLERGKRLQDKNGTILESFATVDGRYNFHSVSANQEFQVNENAELYTGADDKNYEQAKSYLPFMKYLEKKLPVKYKNIYETLTETDFYFDITTTSMEKIDTLKELGVKGEIYKAEYYDDNNIYHCNLFLSNIKICSITVETDYDKNDTILTDESGFLEYDEYDRF